MENKLAEFKRTATESTFTCRQHFTPFQLFLRQFRLLWINTFTMHRTTNSSVLLYAQLQLILTTFAVEGSLRMYCAASFSKLDNQSELYNGSQT